MLGVLTPLTRTLLLWYKVSPLGLSRCAIVRYFKSSLICRSNCPWVSSPRHARCCQVYDDCSALGVPVKAAEYRLLVDGYSCGIWCAHVSLSDVMLWRTGMGVTGEESSGAAAQAECPPASVVVLGGCRRAGHYAAVILLPLRLMRLCLAQREKGHGSRAAKVASARTRVDWGWYTR